METPKSKRGRPQLNAQVAHKQLVDASIELFLSKGFHYTTIDDIVSAAHMGKGTFYQFFKNKEDLLAQTLTEFFVELKQTLTWTHENLENLNETNVILDLFFLEGQRLFETLKKFEKLARVLFLQGRSISQEINALINQFYDELTKISIETYKMIMEIGLIPEQNPHILAMGVIGTVEKIYQEYLFQKTNLTEEQLIYDTIRFLLRGLGVNA